MSKSYKFPIFKTDNRKFAKKQANKKIRTEEDIPKGKSFKKVYPTWNICDQWSYPYKSQWLTEDEQTELIETTKRK